MATIIEKLTTTFTGTDVGNLPTYAAPTPLNLGTWRAAYWVGDSAWAPPANGVAVTGLRDGSGGGQDITTDGTNPGPKYATAVTTLNNRPGVVFTGVEVLRYVFGANITQPWSVVAIAAPTSHTSTGLIIGESSANNGLGMGVTSTSWILQNGTALTGGTPTDTGHLIVGTASGATSKLRVDNVQVASGDSGTGTLNPLAVGAGRASTGALALGFKGSVAFIGVYSGDVTTATWWNDFKTWTGSYYGITVA